MATNPLPTMANPLKPAMRVNYSVDDIRITGPNVDLEGLPDYLKKDCILFYCKEAEPLARKVAALSDKVQLGEVNWKCASAHAMPTPRSPPGRGATARYAAHSARGSWLCAPLAASSHSCAGRSWGHMLVLEA